MAAWKDFPAYRKYYNEHAMFIYTEKYLVSFATFKIRSLLNPTRE